MAKKESEKKSAWKFYLLIGLIGLSIIVSFLFHVYATQVHNLIIKLSHSKSFIAFYLSLFIVSSFISIPFLTFLGARIFPFWTAIIYSLIGNIITMIIMFYIVRWLGRDYLHGYEKHHKKARELNNEFKQHPFRNIILLRFFFPIPPEVSNILGGLSDMKFKDYLIASIIGTIPMTLASVLLIKSYLWKSSAAFIAAAFMLGLMLVIPIFYIAKLRHGLKKGYHKIRKKKNKFFKKIGI